MNITAIIVAAGRGKRAGTDLPKQWCPIAGAPVAHHTLATFRAHRAITRCVLVIHPDDLAQAEALNHSDLVFGAETRAASVLAGLEAVEDDNPDLVLIHDVARPLISHAVIDRVIAALAQNDGAAPAVSVTDALWHGTDGLVSGTQDRSGLYRAQTPQGFRFAPILAAHRAHPGRWADDVEVARVAGLRVAVVEGDERNMKITRPGDFRRAEQILMHEAAGPTAQLSQTKEPAMDIRVGTGFDVHAFEQGDAVILCGVAVPHHQALKGHSDADVGMHALTDAIYGALAEGDIGTHFPPSDPQWKGAQSDIFLRHAVELAAKRGYRLANVDVTLICEAPKIGPHAGAMRAALAAIMGLEVERVSVKATTSEKLGFTGRAEGIAAQAVATLIGETAR